MTKPDKALLVKGIIYAVLGLVWVAAPYVLPSGALYDNIQYSSIPEPSSVALSLVGLAGFGALFLRRRASVQR